MQWLRAARWYGLAVLLVSTAHGLITLSNDHLGPAAYTLFIGAVVISALFGGYGPSLVATGLATLDLLYNFLPPYHSFQVDFENLLFLAVFLTVAILTSTLQARRRRAEGLLRGAYDDLEARVRDRTAELARSQAQLSLLVNGVADQAFFTVNNDGVVTSWNAGATRLLGYSAGDIVGQQVGRILPNTSLRDATAAGILEEQDWAVRQDGSRLWGALVLTPMSAVDDQADGYAVALRDITERRSLERDILDIAEREQERIGRDLHDGLGQELTGIAMLSAALAERVAVGTATTPDAEQVAELVHESISHTRDLARGLCPVNLEDDGLAAALDLLCQRINRLPDIRCHFEHDSEANDETTAPLSETSATHLYRIAQEATTNAIRHGKARHIRIRLASVGKLLTLSIHDDGTGLPSGNSSHGMGIRLMQYRAKMCRGSLNLSSAPGVGTIVECVLEPDGVR